MSRTTRLFTLTWDNSKIPNLAYELRVRQRTAEGTHFATGIVALDNGAVYESMDALERNLKAYGKCRVQYHDEPVQPEPERETEQQAVVSRQYRVPRRKDR